ncbi:hypothetical protein ACFLVE_02575 [Chloroflexota bacterium]
MNYKPNTLELMRKYSLYFLLLASLAIVLLQGSCISSVDKDKTRLGEEFSLPISQSVVITGEDLDIKFVEVSEDSRCPKDVTCVWEGRVTAVVEISKGGSSQQLNLSQPGLTDAPAREQYEQYEVTYKIEPYPEKAEVQITAEEYRLLIIVNK